MAASRTADCPVCELHAESTFKIEGMDCHEEVAILERRLKRLGVERLSADVMSQRLLVTYDAARLSTSAIAEAVAQTGMRAWLEHEAPHVGDGRADPAAAGARLDVGGAAGRRGPPRLGRRAGLAPAAAHRHGRAPLGLAHGPARRRLARGPVGRHPRPDDGGGHRGARDAPVVRGGDGRLPLRRRPDPRGAQHGPGARRHPGAHGARAGRGARAPRRAPSSAWPSTTCGWARWWWCGRARRSRSTGRWWPGRAT